MLADKRIIRSLVLAELGSKSYRPCSSIALPVEHRGIVSTAHTLALAMIAFAKQEKDDLWLRWGFELLRASRFDCSRLLTPITWTVKTHWDPLFADCFIAVLTIRLMHSVSLLIACARLSLLLWIILHLNRCSPESACKRSR